MTLRLPGFRTVSVILRPYEQLVLHPAFEWRTALPFVPSRSQPPPGGIPGDPSSGYPLRPPASLRCRRKNSAGCTTVAVKRGRRLIPRPPTSLPLNPVSRKPGKRQLTPVPPFCSTECRCRPTTSSLYSTRWRIRVLSSIAASIIMNGPCAGIIWTLSTSSDRRRSPGCGDASGEFID